MFGYVRAYKPYLRMCEYDTYRGVYCGLCKTTGSRFGLASRFTLSYDFAFLCILNMSVNRIRVTAEMQHCMVHPIKKIPCATCTEGLVYPANAAVILIFHKLRDDIADRDFKSKAAAMSALPFFKGAYKKARMNYTVLADTIEKAMVLQKQTEDERTASIDKACEPTAIMMKAICEEITDNEDTRKILGRFGYLLGRFIYLCDALDDLRDDYKKGGYNPFLLADYVPKGEEVLPEKIRRRLCESCRDSINLTLGELAESYVRLELEMYKPILDNIIYLGLKDVFEKIVTKQFQKEKTEENL